jgi:predicted nucleic acid-binding protein
MGEAIVSGWKELRGRRGVVLDTMVWIYFFEDHPKYAAICSRLVQEAEAGTFSGVVTPVTAAEILVKPLQKHRADIAERYSMALRNLVNIGFYPLDWDVGFMAGALRAKYGLPLPDVLQAAMALRETPPTLITNDKALKKIAEVNVILLDDLSQ